MTGIVTPFTRQHKVVLSPTNDRVLRLMDRAYRKAGRDPVQAYGDLIAAALLASRFIGLPEEQLVEHIRRFIPQADAAIKARPHIFGGAANDK